MEALGSPKQGRLTAQGEESTRMPKKPANRPVRTIVRARPLVDPQLSQRSSLSSSSNDPLSTPMGLLSSASPKPSSKKRSRFGFSTSEPAKDNHFSKRQKSTSDVEVAIDKLGNITEIGFLQNRQRLPASAKAEVHEISQGHEYEKASDSKKGNVAGNDYRHIKSNAHIKAELVRMFVGQPATEVMEKLQELGFLAPTATVKDLPLGLSARYREEAHKATNLPPGPGADNQRIGRISDQLRRQVEQGRAAFEAGPKTITNPELLRYLGWPETKPFRVESYEELFSIFAQTIVDPPQHEPGGVYFDTMKTAFEDVWFTFARR